jgi:hypothetical protein
MVAASGSDGIGQTKRFDPARITTDHIQSLNMKGIFRGSFAEMARQAAGFFSKKVADAFPADDHTQQFLNRLAVTPGKIESIKIVFGEQSSLNAFHRPSNGLPRAERIQPHAIEECIHFKTKFKIIVADPGSITAEGFKLGAFGFHLAGR